MQRILQIGLLCCASLLYFGAYAQTDTADVKTAAVPKVTPKPRLGLGLGTLTFYGDVGRDQGNYGIGTSDFARRIRLSYPITSYLELSLHGTFGTVHVRETNTPEHFNFQSRLSLYTAEVSYNFSHFLPPKTRVTPFAGVGFSSLEFLTKTDMFDSQGRKYHHWSDGTIRDLPESSFNSAQSTIIHADYVYETDVRELQEGDFGSYPERTWAIPLTAGLNVRLSDRFHSQLVANYYLSFSDLIDNVGQDQARRGSNNDKLLYLGVSLNYDLSITPKASEELIPVSGENGDYYVSINWDGDGDGVHDLEDECLGTPPGVPVDEKGCPLDGDKDGVKNHLDDELDSPEGAPVSNNGIAITDEQFYKNYLFWRDSIPFSEWNRDYKSIFSDRPDNHVFTVRLSTADEELTQEQINALLGSPDLRVLDMDGERVYVAGEFADIQDAIRRKIQLENDGIKADVTEEIRNKETGKATLTSDNIPTRALKAIESELKESLDNEADLNEMDQGIVYRVQIGAYRNPLSSDFFNTVPNLMVLKGNDGLTRYSSGGFASIEDAAEHKINMLLMGYSDSFITSYNNGQRVTLASTGVKLAAGAADPIKDEAFNGIDTDRITFALKLGNFSGDIPTEILDKYLKLGNVKPVNNSDGSTDYLLNSNGTLSGAEAQMAKAKEMGIGNAEIIAFFNDKPILMTEARGLLDLE